MSLAALESAVLTYVVQTLTEDCDRPTPYRAFRYHGPNASIDCCSPDPDTEGYVAISWQREAPSATPSGQSRGGPCLLDPVLEVRYLVCWHLPAVNENTGLPIIPNELVAEWDEDAGMLADVSDCVARALCSLNCSGRADAPELLAQVHCDSFTFLEALPIASGTPGGGGGGCVGVLWRAKARIKPSTVGS